MALTGACVLSTAASAQQPSSPAIGIAPAQPVIVSPPPPACCKLAALTPVELEIVDPASSRTSRMGDKLRIRLAEPVVLNDQILIPKGAEGAAEVIQASKARMMGKAGELVLGMPYIEFNGQRIALKRLRNGPSSGHNGTTEAMIATALVGVVGMVISGGNVEVPGGARANAVVAAETILRPADQTVSLKEGQ